MGVHASTEIAAPQQDAQHDSLLSIQLRALPVRVMSSLSSSAAGKPTERVRVRVVQAALGLVIVPPVLSAMLYILKRASPFMPLYLWAFFITLQVVMMYVYPTLIQPLFNKYEPLQEGALRTSIQQLASGLQYPLKKLFVVDGSKRSAHSNAYMFGFGKNKRIVLFDTLIEQCTEPQVCARPGRLPVRVLLWFVRATRSQLIQVASVRRPAFPCSFPLGSIPVRPRRMFHSMQLAWLEARSFMCPSCQRCAGSGSAGP